jgi:class 3 adenylate cyclase
MQRSFLSVLRSLSPTALASRLQFALLLLFIVAVGVTCVIHTIQWIDRPFAGFLFYSFPGVGSLGDFEWPGYRAGVHYRDVILKVNDRDIATGAEVLDAVDHAHPGEEIRYVLNRRGTMLQLSIPVSVFTLRDFLKVVMPSMAMGAAFWLIGIIVFFMKPDTEVSWAHLLLCLFIGLYMFTGFEMQSTVTSSWSYFLNMFALSFFPAAGIHVALIFPDRTWLGRKLPLMKHLAYALSLLLFAAHSILYLAITQGAAGHDRLIKLSGHMLDAVNVTRLYGLLAAVAVVFASIHAFQHSTSVIARQRARLILISSGMAFLPPTVMMTLVSLYQVLIPFNFTSLTIIAFPAAIGYAIARHNLFDVDVYIKRTVGYVLMTGIVAGGYFVFQTVVKTTILDPLMGASSEKVYPFLFALLTVFAFNPVSQRVQHAVDKLFYRKRYDYKSTVASVSERLTSLVDVQAFIDTVIHTVRTDLFVDRAGVILVDDRTNTSRCTFRGGKFGQDPAVDEPETDPCTSPGDPLLALLARERSMITKYDVAEDPRFTGMREVYGQRFEQLGASLAFPLYYRDQFTGALALGYKKSGHFYTREDIDLLKTLSTMTSTAIEQFREKGQKAVLMQLFSKHVSPQVAESLWEQREQFLEGGRPKSQSMVITAMFTDLQGFSTTSEKQSPEVLMGWLNTYLDMMTTTVMEHGGVVDDFFGDGVKINFGVPIPREREEQIRQDAVNAVCCALAMEQKIIALNERMSAQGQQPLRMRIGIHTGPVVAGSLGSADRMKYTTIGDTVNTAARLESFDKDLVIPRLAGMPCRILVGESTLRLVEGKFNVEKVGELSLKGKDQKISAYCVLGAQAEALKPSVSV